MKLKRDYIIVYNTGDIFVTDDINIATTKSKTDSDNILCTMMKEWSTYIDMPEVLYY